MWWDFLKYSWYFVFLISLFIYAGHFGILSLLSFSEIVVSLARFFFFFLGRISAWDILKISFRLADLLKKSNRPHRLIFMEI